MTITPNFTTYELIHSATANKLKVSNEPGQRESINLIILCACILQPLRDKFGPIIITSGYRCNAVNKAVGGVDNSYHKKGMAADIRIASQTQGETIGRYAATLQYCDKAILEIPAGKKPWLHVQWSFYAKHKFIVLK